MGFLALEQFAHSMHQPVPDEQRPDAPISLSFDDFQGATALLRDVDYPIDRSDEEAWPEFRGWRINYDATALALAKLLDAPPALWTGSRRWPSTPTPPHRPPAIKVPNAGHDRA